ncbi:MAG: hypothetical protein QGH60_19195 [Phycisphaerae bacterium]|jgi:hypothetical protein|nr:hypothetical protein [Phycisphaerae bacterium]
MLAASAVIVANGSSVDEMTEGFWRRCGGADVLLVGTNRALCFKALKGVRLDAAVIRDTYRDLWSDQKFGEAYHRDFWKPADCWKVGPADRRVTHCDQYVRQAPGWQGRAIVDRNGEQAVMKNSSVAIMAANWAWLQGCRTIGLVGVDYCGSHAVMTEPFAGASPGWEGQYDRPVPIAIERQFSRAAAAVESAGGVFANFSPSSRLAARKPADWRKVLGTDS